MTEPGSYASTQISDVFCAATYTFDHLTNLALQLNRIDKEMEMYDEPCSMDTIHDSVKKFTANLENASKMKQASYMRPYTQQPRRTSAQPFNRLPMHVDMNRAQTSKPQNSYRLMPATGLNTIQNGSLMRHNSLNNVRKRPVPDNLSYGISKQPRDIKWVSADGSITNKPSMFSRQSVTPQPSKTNVRREYSVTPRTGNEPQRFLIKKELFQSQNITAITMDDLKPKLPNGINGSLTHTPISTYTSKTIPLPTLRPTVPLTEDDVAVSSLLNTLQQPDSEMSGTDFKMDERPMFSFDHVTTEKITNVVSDSNAEDGEATLAFPGAVLSDHADLIRGHGTYTDDAGYIVSSIAGITHRVNKLLRVKALKARYNGEVGDVVIGRIVEVQASRWMVDINSTQYAVLLLSSVNLPGGELRRKSCEDQLLMTDYLTVGDLVSAEVQRTYSQGFVGLHTRSMKYGKLGQGVLVRVPYYLIKRRKTHFFNLPMGASLVLGCNGTVFISTVRSTETTDQASGGYIHSTESCGIETRKVISRLANCVKILAKASISLSDTTILVAYEASLQHEISSLLDPKTANQLTEEVIQECKQKQIGI
ncbi:unnamed protein product [Bursaphelenchus okinawaensis]|uniref:Ribosomal RNA-processing protein 4 n=1 Tax=Bursaphelenchus okinawaensis TaxID=465554 RepID=A0A811LMK7_9BILA|nr:unnamed protein product [Bursaphelenchus okinawaensis]CAG9125345.1 unnamed protein product [Bursaphelenchus okinawaensis]